MEVGTRATLNDSGADLTATGSSFPGAPVAVAWSWPLTFIHRRV